jgi:hypothetical protein
VIRKGPAIWLDTAQPPVSAFVDAIRRAINECNGTKER